MSDLECLHEWKHKILWFPQYCLIQRCNPILLEPGGCFLLPKLSNYGKSEEGKTDAAFLEICWLPCFVLMGPRRNEVWESKDHPRCSPRSSYFPSSGGDGPCGCPQALDERARDALGVRSFAETSGERIAAWAYAPPGFCWKNIGKFSRGCQYLGWWPRSQLPSLHIEPVDKVPGWRAWGVGWGGREEFCKCQVRKDPCFLSPLLLTNTWEAGTKKREQEAWDSHQTHPIW